MKPYYDQGEHDADIVGQGFIEGEYGWQFTLTIIPINQDHKRTVYLSLTTQDEEGNLKRHEYADASMKVLRHLGFQGSEAETFARLDLDHPNHFSLVGKQVKAYCKHKTKNNGDTVEQWYINTPFAGLAIKPLKKDMARKLDALFGKELKTETPANTPNTTPSSTAPTGITSEEAVVESGGDDIPF